MRESLRSRIFVFYGLLAVGFLLLTGRLFELQIIRGSELRQSAEGNRVQKVTIPASRGIIFDRKGRELVRNVPVYRVKGQEDEYKLIARDEALRLEAEGKDQAVLRTDVGRNYVYGKALAHVLGYLGEIQKEEIKEEYCNPSKLIYEAGDLVGRGGIEQQYDCWLRGINGGEIFEVNIRGEKIREIGKVVPKVGSDIHLSIDAEISRITYEALGGKAGAVVVSEVKTGQILALVSSPSFDPNIMVSSDRKDSSLIEELLNDSRRPFFNRAISGLYPPGSTFKIVTEVAGIQEGKVDANTLYEDTGAIKVGEYIYKNWYFTQYGRTEGLIGIVRAFKRSTDTFFYKVGEWVGPASLAGWAGIFGLGKRTGIDIPSEVEGLVPDPEWKEKNTGERWFLGNTYHFAIGQGDLLTTPLQINMMTGAIANDGKLCLPRVKGQENEGGENCQDLKLKPETLRLIKEGMKEACSTGGTAFPFFDFKPQIACKTGTAEFGDVRNRTHAWFTAFVLPDEALAESGKEQIVVTVLVEGGGEGSYVAAPIAKKIFEAWFTGN